MQWILGNKRTLADMNWFLVAMMMALLLLLLKLPRVFFSFMVSTQSAFSLDTDLDFKNVFYHHIFPHAWWRTRTQIFSFRLFVIATNISPRECYWNGEWASKTTGVKLTARMNFDHHQHQHQHQVFVNIIVYMPSLCSFYCLHSFFRRRVSLPPAKSFLYERCGSKILFFQEIISNLFFFQYFYLFDGAYRVQDTHVPH